ncbi:MAG: tRNA epoxyqueuosine(34) reductase QueG [Flavobacteriales bacterium]|nr:tRNA epoxyqueuosine(34) reductase QueG [Flavobacteriales bacterium]
MLSSPSKYPEMIRQEARRLGFSFCGFSKAQFLEEEAGRLENWLNRNMHGEMAYMANHFDKRLDPRLLVPGAKSIVSLLYNYFPDQDIAAANDTLRISKYAYGQDYHHVIKDKLKALSDFIRMEIGDVQGRAFVDSAPVMDKAWAVKSGLGWMGKNANLINKGHGSFFFIAELIIDLEIERDGPVKDHCGTCTACIDACPTEAIIEPYVVDGSKCISYFTIELKKEIPQEYHGKLDDWVFGCDVCQDVCPWNRFSKPHQEPLFSPNLDILAKEKREWLEMTEEVFAVMTKHSPISRTGLDGMKRNILAAGGQL